MANNSESAGRQNGALSRESVLEVLQLLVRTPSVNPTLAPGEGTGELAIAKAACGWFADRKIEGHVVFFVQAVIRALRGCVATYFFNFAPVNCATAASVVWAAFKPRRKSLS